MCTSASAMPSPLPSFAHESASTLPSGLPASDISRQSSEHRTAKRSRGRGVHNHPVNPTTVMLRDLPHTFDRSTVLDLLDTDGFADKYDFVYLPVKFCSHDAAGYAFINFTSPEDARRCFRHFSTQARWPGANRMRGSVCWSDPHQGLEANIARYRNSPLMHELVPDSYRPAIFSAGQRVPFPAPTRRIKEPRKGTRRMLV